MAVEVHLTRLVRLTRARRIADDRGEMDDRADVVERALDGCRVPDVSPDELEARVPEAAEERATVLMQERVEDAH